MYICKYCGKEFNSLTQLGGHTTFCKLNPKFEHNKNQLKLTQENNNINKHLHCKYCGKELYNEGCLAYHESRCNSNPNAIISKTKQDKILNKLIRESLGVKRLPISKQAHINMSIGAKNRCIKYPYTCGWKGQISKPCENLKQYLRDKGINFVEEYIPLKDRYFSLDIAWPDEKIAIEVNGNQHYNKDGSLKKYYQERHNLLEENGWKIFEIHYSKCYNININDFNDILNLPIYDKDYVGKYFSQKEIKDKQKQEELKIKEIKQKQNQETEEQHKQIIYNLINNSGIDFTKSGWSKKATEYLLNRNEMFHKLIFRMIRKYYPEFLQREDVWKRKGSKY